MHFILLYLNTGTNIFFLYPPPATKVQYCDFYRTRLYKQLEKTSSTHPLVKPNPVWSCPRSLLVNKDTFKLITMFSNIFTPLVPWTVYTFLCWFLAEKIIWLESVPRSRGELQMGNHYLHYLCSYHQSPLQSSTNSQTLPLNRFWLSLEKQGQMILCQMTFQQLNPTILLKTQSGFFSP